jgi:hypothetical protein
MPNAPIFAGFGSTKRPLGGWGAADYQYLQDMLGPDYGKLVTAQESDPAFSQYTQDISQPSYYGMMYGPGAPGAYAKEASTIGQGIAKGTGAQQKRQSQGGQGLLDVQNAAAQSIFGKQMSGIDVRSATQAANQQNAGNIFSLILQGPLGMLLQQGPYGQGGLSSEDSAAVQKYLGDLFSGTGSGPISSALPSTGMDASMQLADLLPFMSFGA